MERRSLLAGAALAPWLPVARAAPPRGNGGGGGAADGTHRVARDKADAIVRPLVGDAGCTALAVAVVRGGTLVVQQGYGLRSVEAGVPPDPSTVFGIQSLSKGLTAVGLLALVGDGRVKLDDPASRHLRGLPRNWAPITVRQFMAHQSGIPQLDRKLPDWEQMLRSADALPLTAEPGTRDDYNNFNYAVIGKLIEAVSGREYLEVMRERVFGPAGMTQTGFDLKAANRAVPYRSTPGGLKAIERDPPEATYGIPSGHLQSTLADLVKFHTALEAGTLLKPGPYRQLVTRATPRFSGTAGWFERKAGDVSIVDKNGLGRGFQSNLAFVPGQGHAVITLCTSTQSGDRDIQRAVNALFADICGLPTRRG